MNQPKNFRDLGIKTEVNSLSGDKIKIERVLNTPVTVKRYKIEPSKFQEKGNGKRLVLQIEYNKEVRVIFTGSVVLMDTIQKIPKEDFPFETTIKRTGEYFEFT